MIHIIPPLQVRCLTIFLHYFFAGPRVHLKIAIKTDMMVVM